MKHVSINSCPIYTNDGTYRAVKMHGEIWQVQKKDGMGPLVNANNPNSGRSPWSQERKNMTQEAARAVISGRAVASTLKRKAA